MPTGIKGSPRDPGTAVGLTLVVTALVQEAEMSSVVTLIDRGSGVIGHRNLMLL